MKRFRLHGANPEKLYRAFDIPMPKSVCDFSTNINAVEWGGRMEIDLKKILCDYPDDDACSVRRAISAQNGCSEDEILVTNGSNESIYLIASYQSGKENRVLQPAYGEYVRALDNYGAKTLNIGNLHEVDDAAETIWICNPCNPTGAFISAAKMTETLLKFPDKLFIVDEAYKDFMFGGERHINFSDFSNLAILRSLTKIYNLCGVRIGYILAPPDLILKLKLRQPTWSVNSLAQSAAEAFLSDGDFLVKTRAYYAQEIPRLMARLSDIGYDVMPTSVNFFLVRVNNDERIISHLLRRGLVVRHTRNFCGLDGGYIRIAARTSDENDRLVEAMKEYQTL